MNPDLAAAPELLARVPDANTWPWVAIAGILLILAAIAFVARRLAPHGL